MEQALTFLHMVFVGYIALFPPVNPIGTALVVEPLLSPLDPSQRKAAALKIALYCFGICASTLAAGSWLFNLFGISLPIVQVAGGILICRMGWQLLSADEKKGVLPSPAEDGDVNDVLFYPVSFPMTTGAGTISVILTLSAHGHSNGMAGYFLNLGALFGAVVFMAVTIFWSYAFTPGILRRLGKDGQQIVNRLGAFLVFCVGLQIAWEGIGHLLEKG